MSTPSAQRLSLLLNSRLTGDRLTRADAGIGSLAEGRGFPRDFGGSPIGMGERCVGPLTGDTCGEVGGPETTCRTRLRLGYDVASP